MQMNFYLRIHSFSYIYDNTFTFPRFFKETKYLYFYVELFDKIAWKKRKKFWNKFAMGDQKRKNWRYVRNRLCQIVRAISITNSFFSFPLFLFSFCFSFFSRYELPYPRRHPLRVDANVSINLGLRSVRDFDEDRVLPPFTLLFHPILFGNTWEVARNRPCGEPQIQLLSFSPSLSLSPLFFFLH